MNSKPLLICGSGNSVSEGIEMGLFDIIPNHYSIGLNYWYKFGCDTTFTSFVDHQFYRDNLNEVKNLPLIIGKHDVLLNNCRMKDGFKCDIVQDNTILLPKSGIYEGKDSWKINKRVCVNCEHEFVSSNSFISKVEHCPKCKDSKIRRTGFYSSHLVGCFALTIGIALGFKEIYLLGYDCVEIENKTHFYQDLVSHEKKNIDRDSFYRGVGTRFNKQGEKLYNTSTYTHNTVNERWFKPYKEEKDVKIYNVSPKSKLDVFDKIGYEEMLENIKGKEINQQDARKEIRTFILDKLKCKN
jgi:predicted Zn-ribbon and HTH transcriptional regulator